MKFTPAYVIKYWYANNQPDSDGNYVHIRGRREGLLSWLLSLIKIEPSVELRATRNELRFSEGSFQGRSEEVIPMRGVCSSVSGYEKPMMKAILLFIGLSFLLGGLGAGIGGGMGGAGGSIVVGLLGCLAALIIALVVYFLNKVFTIGFVANSGHLVFIRFKRSVIEGQEINDQQAQYVAELIQQLIEARVGSAQRP